MKKIAGILICIALAFSFAGCSWQMPEKVSVKTNADYNFALGNFEKDFSADLSIDKLLKDVELPNNGKIYDYWPGKNPDDNTQRFLMYMPLQEIPIDFGSYLENSNLSENIKGFSFEKDIEIPAVRFSYPVTLDLSQVNREIGQQFVLAGLVGNYKTGIVAGVLREIAESISYEKGVLVVKAYRITQADILACNDGASIQTFATPQNLADEYDGGIVTIKSGGKQFSGTFNSGVARLSIPQNGFEFKSDDISIEFSEIPSITAQNQLAFVAKFDTNPDYPYQIKRISKLGSAITVQEFDIPEQTIGALASLSDTIEECTIGTGKIEIDFDIPSEWENVGITYSIGMTGGINLSSGERTASSDSNDNKQSISLNNKTITPENINVNASLNLSIVGATIDFTKAVTLGIESDITQIKTVTVKIPDQENEETKFSYNGQQKLPSEALAILRSIAIKQCGVTGTYTNTLPGKDADGNDINTISLTVSSDFFKMSNQTQNIEAGKEGEAFSLYNFDDENRVETVHLTNAEVPPTDYFNAIDFDVKVDLPGNNSTGNSTNAGNKVTVSNVVPGRTYKLALNITPVFNWESVEINTESLPSKSDSISTGFNPSTIFTSIDNVMGEGFSDKIELPECNLYLYITKPDISDLSGLSFSGSSISMYYGTVTEGATETIIPIESSRKEIIREGKYKDPETGADTEAVFATSAPSLNVEKIDDKNDVITSKLNEADASVRLKISDLLSPTAESKTEGAKLCIDYDISLAKIGGSTNTFTVPKTAIDNLNTNIGSIGIYAVIELPLKFTVKDGDETGAGAVIDLKKIMNKEDEEEAKDLFGREKADSMKDVEKYLDAIQSAELYYRLDAFPIKSSNDLGVELILADENRPVYESDRLNISLNPGVQKKFTIDRTDVTDILNAYPLKLESATISIPENSVISIPRTKKIDVNLQIGLKTDGTIELFKK